MRAFTKLTRALLLTCLFCATAGVIAQPDDQWAQDARVITVHVTVIEPDGDPINNAPIYLYTNNGIGFIRLGETSTTLAASPTEDTVLCASLWDSKWSNLPDAELQSIKDRYNELLGQYVFLDNYSVPLNATDTEYSITISALERIEISGRFVDAAGQPIQGVVGAVVPYMSEFRSDHNGTFIATAAIGRTAVLQFVDPTDESNQIFVLRQAPQHTGQSRNIGDVVIESLPTDSAVNVLFATNQAAYNPSDLNDLKENVTLIRDDGSTIFGYPTNREQTKAVEATWRVDDLPPQIAAGTYYVVAGSVGTDAARALLRSIEDGRQTLLDAAGVPKVTAVPGQTASITINAMDSFNAALSVGADLVED